jgi:outer membrane receptor protein involved in Fe transport
MKIYSAITRSFLVLFLLLTATGMTLAQDATGRIVGNASDPSGAAIPNAKVTVTNEATRISQSISTDKDGFYQVLALPIGNYSVTIEVKGFRKQLFEHQNLQINQSLRIDAKLEIGQQNEIVEVTDQVSTVETVDPTIGGSVTGRTLTDMPLNGRNTLNLALLQPGVSNSNDGDTGSGQGYNIAGGRSDSITYLLDGGLNNENLGNGVVFNPNPDTIAEFRILENNYTAEYGRNGGGIITEVVKSGTNQWHGSAFDYIRNGDFNANSFFNKNNPNNLLPRDALRRNQYGGTFGGPITIPKVVHGKDRFFFFVGYQGQRQSDSQSSSGNVVPTPAELGGDFSQAYPNGSSITNGNGTVLYACNSATGCPDPNVACFLTGFYPNGTGCATVGGVQVQGQANTFFQSNTALGLQAMINPASINSVSAKYIAAGLIPTSPTGTLNVQAPATNNDNQLTMKFDFNVTPKDKFSVTLGGDRNPVLLPFDPTGSSLLGYASTTSTKNYYSNFAYTRIFTPDVLNEFRVTVQRQNILQFQPAETLPTHASVGEVGITPDLESGAAALNFSDQGTFLGTSIDGPSALINNTFAYTDVLSWTRGRHTWKFGGSFSAYQFNTAFDFIGPGIFTFVGAGGIGSGNDFADFLFGIPANFQQGPNARTNARSKNYSGFAQDEWRVNKKLVLTLGVRYEYATPKLDTHGDTFNVIPGHPESTVFPNAPAGLVFPGDANAPRGVNFPDKNNWAPRIGFAWDPKGDSKTSIRGGFGMFYDILKAEDNFQDNGQPPFFAAGFVNFSPLAANPTTDVPYLANPYTSTGAVNPFPSMPPDHNVNFFNAGLTPFGSTSIFLDDPHLKTPYIYQYSLSIERQIALNTSFEVSYLGSSSHGLTSLVDINPFIPGTTSRILNLLPGNSTCPVSDGNDSFNCTYSQLAEFKNIANASYNGFTASLTRQVTNARFIGRTYFILGYTFAHSIDDASGFRNNSSAVPTFDPQLYRASSDFDVKHRITFSGGWDLPFDNMWTSGPKRLTKGWSLYPIFSWRTGFPLTVFGTVDTSGGFTNPGVTGAGDLVSPHANLTGQPLTTFNPRGVQTLTGDFGSNTGNFYFNPAAFTTAQVGSTTDPCAAPSPTCFPSTAQVIADPSLLTYGTASRGLLRGPGRTNLDMSLAKNTAITEKLHLEIRVDVFNLFNHAEFADPVTNITSPEFGQIITTGNPRANDPLARVLQLAAKFTF